MKRFSAEHVRHEAFGMLYVVQNVAVGVAMLTITAGRFASGSTGLSPWRTVPAPGTHESARLQAAERLLHADTISQQRV